MKEQQTTNPSEQKEKVSKQMIKQISSVAAEIAIHRYQEEKDAVRATIKDKRMHNTKLLIKKYRWLDEYNNNAVYETAQLCDDGMDDVLAMMGIDLGERHQVGSIRNSVIITRIIMSHIDTMLGCYKVKCNESKKPEINRRWRVLWYLYLSPEPKNAQEISDIEHISVSMVYSDIDNACEELSSLFFGLDLSEFWE